MTVKKLNWSKSKLNMTEHRLVWSEWFPAKTNLYENSGHHRFPLVTKGRGCLYGGYQLAPVGCSITCPEGDCLEGVLSRGGVMAYKATHTDRMKSPGYDNLHFPWPMFYGWMPNQWDEYTYNQNCVKFSSCHFPITNCPYTDYSHFTQTSIQTSCRDLHQELVTVADISH